ncbi:hypothetical protein Forpe1208_v003499 [Fusarium oxysporum f. sp. rapae]|uniref:Uncharacterized protein n=1 Tax=Fusarium oxysporum f. sp. rapae TaxID=485398 RepID=A0A8J5UCN5_FUSOX|nr:hypothetical protein Forpe1208_v003499 [Fusarium oxysporum f. sp. rapae]
MTSTNSDMAKYPMKKLSSDIKQAQKDDESLRASSVSADVAGDDNTCCFRHFVASLGSAENEETSSSSHLPQIQAHVQQPASDENHIEKGSTEEDSHPTTDLGRKRGNSENEASEGDIYATAKPLQKRAKIGAAHAEVSTAENTGGSLQEYRSGITEFTDYHIPLFVPQDTPVYQVKRDEALARVGTPLCPIQDRASLVAYDKGGVFLTYFLNDENGGGLKDLKGSHRIHLQEAPPAQHKID